jgi:hypothetical protein
LRSRRENCGDQVAAALGEDFLLEENQIRPKGFRTRQDLGWILSFGHDTEIILHGEKLLEAKPENALPVSYENAYFPL